MMLARAAGHAAVVSSSAAHNTTVGLEVAIIALVFTAIGGIFALGRQQGRTIQLLKDIATRTERLEQWRDRMSRR
jgi:hypothetical protein